MFECIQCQPGCATDCATSPHEEYRENPNRFHRQNQDVCLPACNAGCFSCIQQQPTYTRAHTESGSMQAETHPQMQSRNLEQQRRTGVQPPPALKFVFWALGVKA
eukprot:CAMPEP_0117742200 /NCGR_PEP_ID=MMETSP0947-20121206/5409_1 /TAXON_ID=44440 /ORGANISM="Chattonella subsalsa, Strain CCMP2191" /LENGTH=104 /DNA_ID=CAMNT_0005558687 /DNA_START=316 /DNA_END=630 /DNA_ORIENTATION=+